MKEKWFQLPLSGYVQRVRFYVFLIHSSTLSEVVFCATSAYLSPCTRVYVRGLSPNGRIFQIPTVWSNMTTQIPKWYFLISFGYELVAIPRLAGNVVFSDVVRSWFWRHVFVSCWHDGPTRPTYRRHHVMAGSFFLCRMSCRYLIATMLW